MVRTLKARLEELEGPEMSPASLLNSNASRVQHSGAARTNASRTDLRPDSHVVNANPSKRVCTQSTDTRYGGQNVQELQPLPDYPSADLDKPQTPTSLGGIVPATLGTWIKPFDQPSDQTGHDFNLTKSRPAGVTAPSASDQRCSCIEVLDTFSWDMPLRRQADAFVEVYFGRHNRMFPVVHQPTFMRQYEWLWTSTSGGTWSSRSQPCMGFCRRQGHLQLFLALVNVVFALGALFMEDASKHNIDKAETFVSKVWQTDLLTTLTDGPGLEPVQLGLLMSLFLQSTEKFSKCWNILGLTVRIAQSKGLHLDIGEACAHGLSKKSDFSQLQCELRARLWCTCLLLDV